MIYKIEYSDKAKKQIKKLDKQTQCFIKGWIDKNLIGTSAPRQYGKGLTANRSGQWRYRVGNYRIIADIQDDKVIVLVLEVGHRKNIYLSHTK